MARFQRVAADTDVDGGAAWAHTPFCVGRRAVVCSLAGVLQHQF